MEPDDIIDVSQIYFSLFITGISNLTRHAIHLNANNTYFFLDLTQMEPFNFYEINCDDYDLEIFAATDYEFGLSNLDLYTVNETNYIDK